uniref:Apple domain-containing protein n=1 Tax=Ascaris lumbricoides TaxID=6252 RepID=A0A9J2PIG1_ASCLU
MIVVSFLIILFYANKTICYESSGSSYAYERAASKKDNVSKTIRFYHYDNLTDCERVCDLSCEVTHVVYNDEHERKQYTCRKRKPSRTSSFSNLATKGSFTFLFVAAVVMAFFILLLCCCCCFSWCCGGWTPRQSLPDVTSIPPTYTDGFKEHIEASETEEENINLRTDFSNTSFQ